MDRNELIRWMMNISTVDPNFLFTKLFPHRDLKSQKDFKVQSTLYKWSQIFLTFIVS